MALEVRLARPEEYDAVGALTVAGYEAFTLGEADPYVAQLRDARSRAQHSGLWVAADGDELLGTATWCPDGSPAREVSGADEGEFRYLTTAPTARGRGVGAALVARMVALAREEGRHGIALSTLREMHAAHRLYRRWGFRPDPARDWSPMPGVELLVFAVRLEDVPGPEGPGQQTHDGAGPSWL